MSASSKRSSLEIEGSSSSNLVVVGLSLLVSLLVSLLLNILPLKKIQICKKSIMKSCELMVKVMRDTTMVDKKSCMKSWMKS